MLSAPLAFQANSCRDFTYLLVRKTGAPSLASLAAAYAWGLALNRPFVNGNKRGAFLATGLFLVLNGQQLIAAQADATLVLQVLAAGEIPEEAYAAWVREHLREQPFTKD
jgi:death on curing protein